MEKPGDPPSTWRLPYEGGELGLVVVRDLQAEGEIPAHQGLSIIVNVRAADLDHAVEIAHAQAETLLVLLATAARAPAGPARVQVAYETTSGVERREFRQWYWDVPVPMGKAAVPAGAFGQVRTQIDRLVPADQRLVWRSVLSMSWFRQALAESDEFGRFFKLWIALEALEPLLADHYNIEESKGFQGLRALAEERGLGAEWISVALKVRRDLFHGRRVSREEMRDRIHPLLSDLEALLIAAWSSVLHLSAAGFPDESVTPHPLTLQLHGVFLQRDASRWSEETHPTIELKSLEFKRLDTGDPRDVQISVQHEHEVRNADGAQITRLELRGPAGPGLTVEQG
jgi:hypothetical protein